MAVGLGPMLTQDERRRFEAALRDPAGGPPPDPLRTSVYEERVWLAQQQAPAAVLKHVVACRLTGAVDLARLSGAVDALVRARPGLAACYRFDADGTLHKHAAPDRGDRPRLIRVESRQEAVGHILRRQEAEWTGEDAPPFEALLLAGPGETVLALVLHRILDEAHPARNLLDGIGRAYAGAPVPVPPAGLLEADPSGFGESSAPLPTWLRRGPDSGGEAVACGLDGPPPLRLARAARRSTLSGGAGLASPGASGRERLAALAAAAARFVCALTGLPEITLRIAEGLVGDPSPFAVGPAQVRCTVDGRAPAEGLAREIAARIARPGAADEDTLAPARSPTLCIGLPADVAAILRLDGVRVERLALPTLEERPDLTFALGGDERGGPLLELVVGQGLAPNWGPVLLERFAAWLAEGDAALPGRPAAPDAGGGREPGRTAADGASEGAGAVAALILAEFREALNAPEMRPEDDFFDFGGHSLIATRIIGRLLGRHGIELRFDDVFSSPNAADLARKARLAGRPGTAAPAASRGEAAGAPLALAQASLWKAYAAFGFNQIFNLPFALDFLDPVDEALFEGAFTDVVLRHPGLRSLFREEGGAIRQHVVPAASLADYKWFWSSRESAGVDRRDEAQHCFDLSRELPLRLRFLTDPRTGRQVLSFLFHHIALDEWSVNLMMDELSANYRARAAGGSPHRPDEAAPFHAFARMQCEAGIDPGALAYWVERLRDAPPPRPILARRDDDAPEPGADPAAGGWLEFKLDRPTVEGLYALAKRSGASLFNVVYAGIVGALGQLGGLPELVVGTSASGRDDPDYFDTVGYFTTVVAHRIRFEAGMSLGDLVAHVKATINESMPHTGIPIDIVEEALGMTPGRDHLFEVFIQIHAKNKLNGALDLADGRRIAFRQVDPERHDSVLGLQFEVMEEIVDGERTIRVMMNYRSAHYGPAEVERITAAAGRLFSLMGREDAPHLSLDAFGATLAAP